jgi:uncharacterized protein (DUF1778 family)
MGIQPRDIHSVRTRESLRGVIINIRARQRQRDLIDRAAETLGKNRSDFMLETACREAESVLLDKRVFTLDDKAYAKFLTLLKAPAKANRKLRALLKTKAPWETRHTSGGLA